MWERKVKSWNSTGGQGWVCSCGSGSLKLFLESDFILGQGISSEFLTFQRKGGICPSLSDSSYAEMPETEVSFIWEKHYVYGTTENWESELPWALHNQVTCSQGEMQGGEWFPWLQSLKNLTKQLKTISSFVSHCPKCFGSFLLWQSLVLQNQGLKKQGGKEQLHRFLNKNLVSIWHLFSFCCHLDKNMDNFAPQPDYRNNQIRDKHGIFGV